MPRKKAVRKRKKIEEKPSQQFKIADSYASFFLGFAVVVLAIILVLSFVKGRRHTAISSAKTESLPVAQIEKSFPTAIPTVTSALTSEPTTVPTNSPTVVPISSPTTAPTQMAQPIARINQQMPVGSYTVKSGDTLWDISQSVYNSGFLWHRIATANNISDPANLTAGTVLKIPQASSRPSGVQISQNTPNGPPSINTNTYTVVHGDTLWDIAVRKYGDGYRWVDIAKANNLANPGLIFSGNVLALP